MADVKSPRRINYPPAFTDEQITALDNMFIEARKNGHWFHGAAIGGSVWFSPDELQREQLCGRFIFPADAWTLKDPAEHLAELDRHIDYFIAERESFLQRSATRQ